MKVDQLRFFIANVAQRESLRNCSINKNKYFYTDIRHKLSFCQTSDLKCEITCCIKLCNISIWLPLRAPLKYTKFSKSKEFLLLISQINESYFPIHNPPLC